MTRLLGLGATTAALALLPFTPATAQPQSTGRPTTVQADDPAGGAQFNADGVRIRSCPSLSCTVLGLGYRDHFVSWYCGQIENGFVHILDRTTGVDGWASAQYLYYYCD
ncbi:SH3 domain-containing protein [Streptomyces sp. NPDC001595]|uniref:SH3 domain-containing protein n=1 Tax=Streptomyces sp. NPDC001532 TaxID=3154520 RepID=UPI00333214B2